MCFCHPSGEMIQFDKYWNQVTWNTSNKKKTDFRKHSWGGMGSLPSLKLTFLNLKMDGWNTIFSFPFWGLVYVQGRTVWSVSFREGIGVSKNRDTPKWMVKIMENPIKMDDLGVPLFSETSVYFQMSPVKEVSPISRGSKKKDLPGETNCRSDAWWVVSLFFVCYWKVIVILNSFWGVIFKQCCKYIYIYCILYVYMYINNIYI